MWLIWFVGAAAYMIAVTQRTTLGPAGDELLIRFHTVPGVLSAFVFVQLIVYSLMQIPCGVLLDRFGPRVLLATGAILMAVGQLIVALSDAIPPVIAARIVLGLGDALTFNSAIRLTAMWFTGRSTPLMMQLTQVTGQFGQILSAVPFALVLHLTGWTPAFVSGAALSTLAAVAVIAIVRTIATPGIPSGAPRHVWDGVVHAWRDPGTRLGAFAHLVTQYAGSVFVVLWGVPFLTQAVGLSPATTSLLVTIYALLGMAAGPVIGRLTGLFPRYRLRFLIGVVIANAIALTLIIALPQPLPFWAIVVWIVMLSLTNPASLIGQDFARSTIPERYKGTAIGTVNMGGWTAAPVTVIAIGVILQLVSHGATTPTLGDYRAAFSVEYAVWAVGLVLVGLAARRWRRDVRRVGSSPEAASARRP